MESDLTHPNVAGSKTRSPKFGTELTPQPTALEFQAPPALERLFRALAVVGGISLLAGAILAPQRTWANLLLASYYLLALGLAGTVFVALQYVTGSSRSRAVRRRAR